MRSLIWLLLSSLLLFSSPVAAAVPEFVGDYGDPDRIQFVGNETFDAKLIRSSLRYDVDYLLAGHPKSSTKALLELLQQRLEDGYLNSGFPDPQVTVRFDDEQSAIVATIIEGPRYNSAGVQVTGASTLSVERFVERLVAPKIETSPTKSSPKSLWLSGKPASFSANYWQSKHESFQKIFQSLGYYDVSFSVSARPLANRTATLIIEINDEGPRALLGSIEVVGAKKNTAEDVIHFLDLPPGTVLDADTKLAIEKKLASAARFLKHDVEIISPPFGNEASTLKVTLVEYDDAPALNEPFSAAEETMVRLAHWLNKSLESEDDFEASVVHIPELKNDATPLSVARAELRVAISHRNQAFLLYLRVVAKNDQELFESWIHLTPKTITLDAPKRALRFEADGLVQCVVGNLSWTANPPDSEGRMSRFNFSMGVKGDSHLPLPPFFLHTTVDPVAALREAHKQKDSLKVTDDILAIEQPDVRLAIERATGRLLKWESTDATGRSFRVRFEPGRYEKLLAEYHERTSQSRVIVPGEYPISNLLTFLANCAPDLNADAKSQTEIRIALIQALLKRGAFHAFDTLLFDFINQPQDSFYLPPPPAPSKKIVKLGWNVFLLPASSLLVPSPSWPITISREYVFAQSKNSHLATQSIQTLLSDQETGPLVNLSAAYVFGMLHPQLRIGFARCGLTRLQRERLIADCQPLLDVKAPVGKLLFAATQTLQELDDHEIESLVGQLPLSEGDHEALAHALRLIPAHQNDSPLDAIRVALDDAWEPLIEPYLRAWLSQLAN